MNILSKPRPTACCFDNFFKSPSFWANLLFILNQQVTSTVFKKRKITRRQYFLSSICIDLWATFFYDTTSLIWTAQLKQSDFLIMDAKDCLFLTVNSRLSRHLLKHLDNQHNTQQAWETSQVMPFNQWLVNTFLNNNLDGEVLLSDFQALCLWEDIITQTKPTPALLQPTQTAQLIYQAWQYLLAWQVADNELTSYQTQLETQYLTTWIEAFKTRCKKNRWITNSQLPQKLITIDNHQALILPEEIKLVGFDDLAPNAQALLDQLSSRTHISHLSLEQNTPNITKIFLKDNEEELEAMATWAQSLWQENPNQSIACIVPDLQKQQALVRTVFTHTFCLDNILPSNSKQYPPFNLSAGQALDQHPMIHVALRLLQWSTQPLPITQLSYLLQSPFLCQSEAEKSMGAMIDERVRKANRLLIKPQDLFEILAGLQTSYPETTWLMRLRLWVDVTSNPPKSQPPSQWATYFINALKSLKWPGQHTQQSETFQYLERFKKLLRTFSQLDNIFPSISIVKALSLLKNLTSQTIFQPKSHQEPIQIMGTLEASGLTFDAVWVMGLHSGIWPAPAKPNPFIPLPIQQAHQMPHATAARELHFCQQVTERLKTSAKQVIFSIPQHAGDQELHPTQLLEDISASDPLIIPDETTKPIEALWASRNIEDLSDEQAPAVTQPSAIRGGSYILKLQATCPFKAFATIRLAATEPTTPQIGLDAATRGTLAHQVLFLLWGQIDDQKKLNSLLENDINLLISNAINEATNEFITQQIKQDNHYFWQIEKQRLHKLITSWLALEKERPYFQVVQREAPINTVVDKLPLKLRIDRVDRLADGSYLLIDYKTGLTTPAHWLKHRLTDPQLPLYAAFTKTADNQYYSGLAFAQVNNASLAFKGIVHESHPYATQPTPGFTAIHRMKNALQIHQWEALQNHWQLTLTQLAKDFCSGIAKIDPVNAQACQFCELHSLCRIGNAI